MQRFADALTSALRTRGVSRRQLAVALSLQPTTLGTWISTNRFPTEQAVRIARELGLAQDADDLQEHFAIEFTQIHPATHISLVPDDFGPETNERDRRLRELAHATSTTEDLAALLDTLGEGSIYAYFSLDRLPDELSPAGWPQLATAFTAAVGRGMSSIYLYPDELAGKRLAKAGVSGVHHPLVWESRIAQLRRQVATAVQNAPLGQRIFAVEARNLAFSSPGQAYLMTRASHAGALQGRVLLLSMGGTFNLPLPPSAEADLAHMLARAVECDRSLSDLLHTFVSDEVDAAAEALGRPRLELRRS